jgi:gentisate 1,2-dioxygenase
MTATRTTKIPDGKGGWTTIEGELLPGATADAEKQRAALHAQFIKDAASITESLVKFDYQLIKEGGLKKEHRAFAAALYCINLRETYPGADGKTPDPGAFDVIAEMAADYYDTHSPRKS